MKLYNKPTYEEYYPDGNIQYQSWWKNSKCHRTNGLPAIIYYYQDGKIEYQAWEKNGNRHRTNGLPASISYYENGSIEYQKWYENGKPLSDKQVLQRRQEWLTKIINSFNNEGIDYYE